MITKTAQADCVVFFSYLISLISIVSFERRFLDLIVQVLIFYVFLLSLAGPSVV